MTEISQAVKDALYESASTTHEFDETAMKFSLSHMNVRM